MKSDSNSKKILKLKLKICMKLKKNIKFKIKLNKLLK